MKRFFSHLFVRPYELRSKMPKDALLRLVGKAHGQWSDKGVAYRVRVSDDGFTMRESRRLSLFYKFPMRGQLAEATAKVREENGETVIAIRLGVSPLTRVLLWFFHGIFAIYSLVNVLFLIGAGIGAAGGGAPMDWEPLGVIALFLLLLFIFRWTFGRAVRQLEEYLEELLIF